MSTNIHDAYVCRDPFEVVHDRARELRNHLLAIWRVRVKEELEYAVAYDTFSTTEEGGDDVGYVDYVEQQ